MKKFIYLLAGLVALSLFSSAAAAPASDVKGSEMLVRSHKPAAVSKHPKTRQNKPKPEKRVAKKKPNARNAKHSKHVA